jgi:PAS domain S-box-containing protein
MRMTRSTSGRAFGVALLVLAAIGVIGYRNTTELDRHFNWVEHTYETRAQLQELNASLLTCETARRGFSITGDELELERFEEAVTGGRASVAKLRVLTADNPSQQTRLDDLEPRVKARTETLAALVAARRNALDHAAEQVSTREGTRQSAAIQRAIGAMDAEEARLLDRRAADMRLGNRRTTFVVALGTLVGFGILIAVFQVLRREVAARARGEARLREWGRIFDHAGWGIATASIDGGGLTLVNPAFAGMHGLQGDEHELHGRALVDLVVPEHREAMADALVRARATGHSALESSHVAPGGRKRAVAVDIARLDGDDVSPASLVINVQDITERQDAERDRDRFFELSIDIIAVANLDGSFVRVNPSFEAVLGYTAREITSRPFIDFVHPDDVDLTNRESARLSEGQRAIGFENRYRCKDGSFRWLEWTVAPDLENHLLFAVARDTTASKAATAEIAALNVQLVQRIQAVTIVNEELETFSYSVSHDLRSPLRGIDGFSQALLEDYGDVLDANAVGYLDRIRAATQRMGHLIDDLLKLSKITRASLQRQPTDVSALARSIVTSLREAEPAREIAIEVADDLRASADPQLLEIALENLLRNAWKFTTKVEHPRIQVGAHVTADGARGFFVKDNGAGFDMVYADKLFGAFQRLHAASEFSGTGIGLATVRRIVTRHDGRVWADSRAGEGASFFITL